MMQEDVRQVLITAFRLWRERHPEWRPGMPIDGGASQGDAVDHWRQTIQQMFGLRGKKVEIFARDVADAVGSTLSEGDRAIFEAALPKWIGDVPELDYRGRP
jgi:hypothetical protein